MRTLRPSPLTIRIIYAICLAGAGVNHGRVLYEHGLSWDYGGMPLFVCAYWTTLTFLDPLAAFLLLARPRLGVMLTVAIISSDVALNAWVAAKFGIQLDAFIAQVLFLGFVLATARLAWPRRRSLGLSGGTSTMGFPPTAKRL